ncbi:MAG: hypothetical protein IPH37_10680 [Burkholderiales bacterium]|nr:hypothetical protein [Burkholderiales bacterium]
MRVPVFISSMLFSVSLFGRDIAQEVMQDSGEVDSVPLDGIPNIIVGLIGFGIVVQAFERSIWLGVPALAALVAVVFAMVAFPMLPWALLAVVVMWFVAHAVTKHFRDL